MNDAWQVRSRLISCRHFNPASEIRDGVAASFILAEWTKACLAEFGLTIDDVFAMVTDSGSDVKRCASSAACLQKPWEWCGPHMLNRALIEGAGYDEDKAKSGNPTARQLIYMMRNCIMTIKKSDNAKVGR